MERTIHHGKNVARFRQMLGIKQDALAAQLGEDWTQVNISRLEAKEEIEDALLSQISAALKIPVEAIKHFDEEAAVVNIQNNYEGATGNGISASGTQNNSCNINPLEKYVEAVDKIEKLYAELLKAKEEQIEMMKKLLER